MDCPPKKGRCREVVIVEGWSLMEVRLYVKGKRLDAGQGSPRIKFCSVLPPPPVLAV